MELADLNLGSADAPEPLLPETVCLIPLVDINSALASCRKLHSPATTEDAMEHMVVLKPHHHLGSEVWIRVFFVRRRGLLARTIGRGGVLV
jgi:hypothetical protein